MANKTYENLTMKAGISIRKHKTKDNLQISFEYKGKTKRKTLDIPVSQKNIDYAANVRGEYQNQIEREIFDVDDFDGRKKTSLIKDLLKVCEDKAEIRLKASSFNSYKKDIKILTDNLGDLNIADLTAKHISDFIESRNSSLKRINNLLAPFKRVCRDAYKDEKIKKNPFDLVDVGEHIPTVKHKKKDEIDPFDYEEMNQIINAADGPLKNMIIFAFWTGLRIGELFGLKWIDIKGKTVNVCRSITEKVENLPKTESGERTLELLPMAFEAIECQRLISDDENEYVFFHPDTLKHFEDDQTYRSLFKTLIKKTEVRYRKPSNTRHTFASMMLSSGENLLWVSKYLGHKKPATTLKHYSDFIPNHNDCLGGEALKQFQMFEDTAKKAA